MRQRGQDELFVKLGIRDTPRILQDFRGWQVVMWRRTKTHCCEIEAARQEHLCVWEEEEKEEKEKNEKEKEKGAGAGAGAGAGEASSLLPLPPGERSEMVMVMVATLTRPTAACPLGQEERLC